MLLRKYITSLFFLLLFVTATIVHAQVVINFNSAVYGQSLDGLSYVQFINSSNQNVKAKVIIRVKELSAGNVLTATFISVPLNIGSNTLDRRSFSAGRFAFGNNYYGLTLSQTGKFPEGEYEYCFEVEITDAKWGLNNPYFESCFDFQLQPLTPLLLINPADGDEDCNARPAFIWQLPLPLPPDAKCRLVLTEVKEKQDIAEAINYNIPVINQGNIFGNQLIFPAGAPQLKEGKQYAWQVTVYTGKTILKRSEIWTYSVKCDKDTEQTTTDSYRELKENEDGDFYVADKVLRFSFNNPYDKGMLEYTITGISDPGSSIKNLPKLKLEAGLNKYDLDLSENRFFKSGQEYMLIIKLANSRELRLRFLYKTE